MTKKLRILLFLVAPFFMNAQCGPSYSDNASPRNINSSVGISFTTEASCSGLLTNIVINGFNNMTAPIPAAIATLYAGNGTSGSMLGQLTNINITGAITLDFSAANITMNAATQYTIIVEKNSTESLGIQYGFNTPWNAYTGGSLFDDGVEMPGLHINFSVSIDNSTLSTDDISSVNRNIQVYPNPAATSIQITALQQQENYIIFDAFGKKVVAGIVKGNEKISIESLQRGMYFIQIDKKVLKLMKN